MRRKWKPEKIKPDPGRLFVVASFDDPAVIQGVRRDLAHRFGEIDYESESIHSPGNILSSFLSHSSSAKGKTVRILSFRRPAGREELVDIQNRCLEVVARTSTEKGPAMDLVCGYVTRYNAVRASLEDDFHRVYLHNGVFAEALYYYEKMSYHPFSHCDPFYQRKDIITVFNDLRMIYKGEFPG